MTTIATDGKTIAADGLQTGGGHISSWNVNKLRRVGDDIVGFCGAFDDAEEYFAWLRKPESAKPVVADSFCAIHLNRSGVYITSGRYFHKIKVDVPYAIGSGDEYAIGAMLAGASPAVAVRIAAQRDTATGGKIRIMRCPK